MNTYNTFMSKTGFTGMRNLNLVRIDKMLKDMFYECEALMLKCKEEQSLVFSNWSKFTFVMASLITPILFAIRHDIKIVEYDLRVILAPVSLAWALLLFVLFMIIKIMNKYHTEIKELSKFENFLFIEKYYGPNIKGRNAYHCSQIQRS